MKSISPGSSWPSYLVALKNSGNFSGSGLSISKTSDLSPVQEELNAEAICTWKLCFLLDDQCSHFFPFLLQTLMTFHNLVTLTM